MAHACLMLQKGPKSSSSFCEFCDPLNHDSLKPRCEQQEALRKHKATHLRPLSSTCMYARVQRLIASYLQEHERRRQVNTDLPVSLSTCVCMHICMCVCLYVCVYVCICVYMYTHRHTYIYIYIHTHKCICTSASITQASANILPQITMEAPRGPLHRG